MVGVAIMKHFTDESGAIYAFDQEQVDLGLSDGMTPVPDPESPKLPEFSPEIAKSRRCLAYADPINGSDRLFMDYHFLLETGALKDAEAKKAEWLLRVESINEETPITVA